MKSHILPDQSQRELKDISKTFSLNVGDSGWFGQEFDRVVATRTQRYIEDVLVEWLDSAASDVPVELLPDDEVLALYDMEMPYDEQERLDELLYQQRERELTEEGRKELGKLMDAYRRGLVRKTQAMVVAVERGLRPPLSE